MPSTELWPSGKPNESENRFLFVHLGYYAPTGLGIFGGCSPFTFITLDITTPHCRPLSRRLSSQNFSRWWIACAITKKPLQDGLTAKPQSVPAMFYALMPFVFFNSITTWSWTATTYISRMAHTHSLRLVRFKTKSFHLSRKFRHRFAWLCGRGLPGTHSLSYKSFILMSFGIVLFNFTTTPSTTTSLTKTSAASNVSFQKPSFTTRTSELHFYGSTAPYSTSSASPPPSPTRWYFASWSRARVTSSRRPSPRSTANLAKHTHGHLGLDETYRMPTFFPNERNSSKPGDPLSASSRHLFDQWWIALPSWSTTFYPKRFPTTWHGAMYLISSSFSRIPILTRFPLHEYTTKILRVFSQALTLTASSLAGA